MTALPDRSPRAGAVLAVLLVSGLGAAAASAAEIEVTAIGGVQQTGDVTTENGQLDVGGGTLFGLSFGWRVRPDGIVEFAWTHSESGATGATDTGLVRFDVTIDSIEFGGLWESSPGRTRPFLALSVGGSRVAGPGQDFGDGWAFSGSISGGFRHSFGPHVLGRLEARAAGVLLADRTAITCSSLPGQCTIVVTGSGVGVFSLRAALAARF